MINFTVSSSGSWSMVVTGCVIASIGRYLTLSSVWEEAHAVGCLSPRDGVAIIIRRES